MREMVERVAKAIHEENAGKILAIGGLCLPFAECSEGYKRTILDMALSAVRAMREPTPAMLSAGDCTIPNTFLWSEEAEDGTIIHGSHTVWRAMIDEALK